MPFRVCKDRNLNRIGGFILQGLYFSESYVYFLLKVANSMESFTNSTASYTNFTAKGSDFSPRYANNFQKGSNNFGSFANISSNYSYSLIQSVDNSPDYWHNFSSLPLSLRRSTHNFRRSTDLVRRNAVSFGGRNHSFYKDKDSWKNFPFRNDKSKERRKTLFNYVLKVLPF